MKNIAIIFKREYLSRVKNKSFILMTFLGPLIFIAFYAIIGFIAYKSASTSEYYDLKYTDVYSVLNDRLDNDTLGSYICSKAKKEYNAEELKDNGNLVYLKIEDQNPAILDSVTITGKTTPSVSNLETINSRIKELLFEKELTKRNLTSKEIENLKSKIKLKTIEITENGEKTNSNSGIKSAIGMIMAFVIYIFIFMYGAMVMRSTVEEKTNRIIEVIISSIKPFELMMGKILGVAAVGLTQFVSWIVLMFIMGSFVTIAFGTAVSTIKPTNISINSEQITTATQNANSGQINELLLALHSLPFAKIIVIFLLFFIGGYLLYSSMFAAIGSAVSQDSDTQQFMLPVAMPLIVGFVVAQSAVVSDPNGTLVTIFSYIPFTSPIVMSVRAAFGVSWLEIFTSFALLFATFLFMVWLSARIYRVGILLYGQKPKWKDLLKWIFTKD